MVRLLIVPTLLLAALAAAAQTPPPSDPISLLVEQVEQAVLSGDQSRFTTLSVPSPAPDGPDAFWAGMSSPSPDRIVIKERDRTPLEGGDQQLLLEILTVSGQEGRVGTWNARVRRTPASAGASSEPWKLVSLTEVSAVTGMYRLSLDTSHQYAVSRLTIPAPDFTLSMSSGNAFVATIADGATVVVLLGRGTMTFTPPDEAERTQVQLFAGAPSLSAEFDAVLLRINPGRFAPILASDMLKPVPVSATELRRAAKYFDENISRTLTLDLSDLSRERWSLVPPSGDVVAEVRTRRFGILTYARTASQSEDISLFERSQRRNISIYASKERLADHGRFYDDSEALDFDIESVDLESDIDPARYWIEGTTSLTLLTRYALTSLTLKLAEPLTVRSIVSPEFGRVIFLRIVGQDSVIVKLPTILPAGRRFTLRIAYGGRLVSQDLSSDAPSVGQSQEAVPFEFTPEPRYIYSTNSYWYPQSSVLDYVTARMRISVPADYDVVASGVPQRPRPMPPGSSRTDQRPRTLFEFVADRPVPYLASVISRFDNVSETTLKFPSSATSSLSFIVQANRRQVPRAREVSERATEILAFYSSLLGDVPYSTLTLAVSENDVPGGHSPAYLALVDQPLSTTRVVWRDDPVSFPGYPSYVLAHELAHQWWGQAVGGKNYHERWISEGFAQYFAAICALHERGPDTFDGILRQMQRSAIEVSSQGPISLGYRLGHVRGNSRVFRAILYNKSAMVLHMLRRLIGDDAFFDGLRRFYTGFRFQKAGTDDFRKAMEQASGRNLQPFIDAWIFGSATPRLRVTRTASPTELTMTFEHTGPVMPVPVTVTVVYADGSSQNVVVPVVDKQVSHVIPLRGALRDVRIDDDHAALATFETKRSS